MMAWKFSPKGGRAWWGKREAKKAGNVTRRRQDRVTINGHDLDPEAVVIAVRRYERINGGRL